MWKFSSKVVLWQLGVSLLIAALGYVASTYLHFEMPSASAALAMMIGAQSCAMSAEAKTPGRVTGHIWMISWRAAVMSTVFGAGFGYFYLTYTASLVPEFSAILDQINQSPAVGGMILVATFLITLGTTALGLKLGAGLATRKRAVRQVP